jgi:hypothetical protein
MEDNYYLKINQDLEAENKKLRKEKEHYFKLYEMCLGFIDGFGHLCPNALSSFKRELDETRRPKSDKDTGVSDSLDGSNNNQPRNQSGSI